MHVCVTGTATDHLRNSDDHRLRLIAKSPESAIDTRNSSQPNPRRTQKRVDEIVASESPGDEDGHVLTVRRMNGNVASDVGKDFSMSHGLKSKLAPVRVGGDYG